MLTSGVVKWSVFNVIRSLMSSNSQQGHCGVIFYTVLTECSGTSLLLFV